MNNELRFGKKCSNQFFENKIDLESSNGEPDLNKGNFQHTNADNQFLNFENSDWLTGIEAAVFLRLFKKNGEPCVERLRNLVHQGRVPFYKPFGRLMFRRSELDRLIETSRKGGFKWR